MSTDTALEPLMQPAEWAAVMSLVSTLSPTAQILEFGAGGSTVALSHRLRQGQRLTSIESDLEWFHRVRLAEPRLAVLYRPRTLKLEFSLYPPLRCSISAWIVEECTAGLSDYLDMHYGNDWDQTDLVLVDGLARGTCLALLRPHVHPGTTVLLHDWGLRNADEDRTEWYRFGVELYETVSQTESLLVMRA